MQKKCMEGLVPSSYIHATYLREKKEETHMKKKKKVKLILSANTSGILLNRLANPDKYKAHYSLLGKCPFFGLVC